MKGRSTYNVPPLATHPKQAAAHRRVSSGVGNLLRNCPSPCAPVCVEGRSTPAAPSWGLCQRAAGRLQGRDWLVCVRARTRGAPSTGRPYANTPSGSGIGQPYGCHRPAAGAPERGIAPGPQVCRRQWQAGETCDAAAAARAQIQRLLLNRPRPGSLACSAAQAPCSCTLTPPHTPCSNAHGRRCCTSGPRGASPASTWTWSCRSWRRSSRGSTSSGWGCVGGWPGGWAWLCVRHQGGG